MATIFKSIRANDLILSQAGALATITTRTGHLTLSSASSGDVRVGYDLPSNDRSIATKIYVDSVSQGLTVKEAVRARTSAALTGSVVTYGTNTITKTTNGAISGNSSSFDGITLAFADRVLYASETSTDRKYHGIYVVTNIGSAGTPWVLTRSSDSDNLTITSEVKSGLFVLVTAGTLYTGSGWVLTTANPITLNTTELDFTQFSAVNNVTLANIGGGQGIYASTVGSTYNLNSLAAATGANSTNALELSTAANLITYRFDSSKVTATGALTTGSINWSGAITTSANVTGANVIASTAVQAPTVTMGTSGTIAFSDTVSGNNKITVQPSKADALSITNGSSTKYLTIDSTGGNVILHQSKLDLSTAAAVVSILGNSATSLAFQSGANSLLTLDTTTSVNKVIIPQGIIAYAPASSGAIEIDGSSSSTFAIRNTANSKNYISVSTSGSDVVAIPQGILSMSLAGSNNIYIPNSQASALIIRNNAGATNHMTFDSSASRNISNTQFVLDSGFSRKVVTALTSNTTLGSTQDVVPVNATSASLTITLPSVATNSGRLYKISKSDATANTVTVAPASGESIAGVTNDTIVIDTQYDNVALISNGTTWLLN
jgi:hypothetical protein